MLFLALDICDGVQEDVTDKSGNLSQQYLL